MSPIFAPTGQFWRHDFLCVGTLLCPGFPIEVPRTDNNRVSLLLIPTSNVDLHNCPPPTKHKKIILRLHPLTSLLLHLLPCRCLTSHPLCLFVCPFVCSFGWLLHPLSAPCRRFPSRHVAMPRRCAALHLSSSLSSRHRQVIASLHLVSLSLSCRCIASRSSRVASRSSRVASCSVVISLSIFV